ncbi:MAG: flagellar hook-length control protein FliK [Maritimibacter sp.]
MQIQEIAIKPGPRDDLGKKANQPAAEASKDDEFALVLKRDQKASDRNDGTASGKKASEGVNASEKSVSAARDRQDASSARPVTRESNIQTDARDADHDTVSDADIESGETHVTPGLGAAQIDENLTDIPARLRAVLADQSELAGGNAAQAGEEVTPGALTKSPENAVPIQSGQMSGISRDPESVLRNPSSKSEAGGKTSDELPLDLGEADGRNTGGLSEVEEAPDGELLKAAALSLNERGANVAQHQALERLGRGISLPVSASGFTDSAHLSQAQNVDGFALPTDAVGSAGGALLGEVSGEPLGAAKENPGLLKAAQGLHDEMFGADGGKQKTLLMRTAGDPPESLEPSALTGAAQSPPLERDVSVGPALMDQMSVEAKTAQQSTLVLDAPTIEDIPLIATTGEARSGERMSVIAPSGSLAHSPDMARHVAAQIVDVARVADDGVIEVMLKPEELGRLSLTFNNEGGMMTVSLSAERPETLELLKRNIDQLDAAMQQLGYGEVTYDFSQGDQDQNASYGVAQSSPESSGGTSADGAVSQDMLPLDQNLRAASGGMDIRL